MQPISLEPMTPPSNPCYGEKKVWVGLYSSLADQNILYRDPCYLTESIGSTMFENPIRLLFNLNICIGKTLYVYNPLISKIIITEKNLVV